ncbi:MAG: O-methyltransferase [Chloroflexota bacterium]|nr:MAG: methyltransferase [Chloroflexota bacterium]
MSDPSLSRYAKELFGGANDALAPLVERSLAHGLPAIQVPFELGRLLQVLVVQSNASRILEIGTLFGYSAILMASVLPDGGRITTLEADPTHAMTARENIADVQLSGKIEILEGPAQQTLERLNAQSFDLVFIDADKTSYPLYLDWALRLTLPGATIVADNLWREGAVEHPEQTDEASTAIRLFNQKLAGESRLLSTLVATRDAADAASVSVVLRD